MGKFWAALEVLQKGKSLSHPGGWKNAQALANFITALGALAAMFYPQAVQQVDALTGALAATAVAGVNVYLTLATSEKVGVGAAPVQEVEPYPPEGI